MPSSRFRLFAAATVLAITPSLDAQATFNFNANGGGFTVASDGPVESVWTHGATAGVGGNGAWFVDGTQKAGAATSSILTSPALTVSSTDPVILSFDHRYSFDYGDGVAWDGGLIQVSVNGGAFTTVANGSFTANGYTGTNKSDGILSGEEVFGGESPDYGTPAYITSTATLGAFGAGDTLQIRFVAAWNDYYIGSSPNWVVDNVSVSNVAVPEPQAYAAVFGLATLGWAAYRRRRRRA
jgi:hypothetical protein